MIKSGYCSTTVANYGGTWLIRFVSKSYIHLWKIFTNKFRLVLHACIRFFFEKNFRCEPNMAPRSLSYVALSEEWVRKILGSMEISPSYCANLIWRKGRKRIRGRRASSSLDWKGNGLLFGYWHWTRSVGFPKEERSMTVHGDEA